jgi:hypothetical protein
VLNILEEIDLPEPPPTDNEDFDDQQDVEQGEPGSENPGEKEQGNSGDEPR